MLIVAQTLAELCCAVLQVWLGGSSRADRLAEPLAGRVKVRELEAFLEPVFTLFREQRQEGESLGDWAGRVGLDAIREATQPVAA